MSQDVAVTAETVTSADGTVIAYEKAGSGPALVHVDGAMVRRAFGPARDVASALSDRFTVYIYDRRGRDDSGDTQPYAVEREIEDLQAVLAATGEVPFVLGQSSGAALALRAAASGVPMRKLAVYEAPYIGKTTVNHVGALRGFLAKDDRAGAVGYFLVKMVGAPAFVPLMMRMMRGPFTALKAAAHTLPYDAEILGDFSVPTDMLEAVPVPTLVMGGSKAKPNMKAAVAAVADAVPGSVRAELAGQTHQVSGAALRPELLAFFASSPSRQE
jgi:pimeloyl-ACP methyl ester carboxylesterase